MDNPHQNQATLINNRKSKDHSKTNVCQIHNLPVLIFDKELLSTKVVGWVTITTFCCWGWLPPEAPVLVLTPAVLCCCAYCDAPWLMIRCWPLTSIWRYFSWSGFRFGRSSRVFIWDWILTRRLCWSGDSWMEVTVWEWPQPTDWMFCEFWRVPAQRKLKYIRTSNIANSPQDTCSDGLYNNNIKGTNNTITILLHNKIMKTNLSKKTCTQSNNDYS